MNAGAIPEVQFKIDDDVTLAGGTLAVVMVVYVDRREALVRFSDGQRELIPLAELQLAREGAADLIDRYPRARG